MDPMFVFVGVEISLDLPIRKGGLRILSFPAVVWIVRSNEQPWWVLKNWPANERFQFGVDHILAAYTRATLIKNLPRHFDALTCDCWEASFLPCLSSPTLFRWYPRFFGAHQRQKTTPPKKGPFQNHQMIGTNPSVDSSLLPQRFRNQNWFLTSATRGFCSTRQKGKNKKKRRKHPAKPWECPGGKAGEGAYPGATPSRLPPTP